MKRLVQLSRRVGVIIPTMGTRENWLVQCLMSLEMQAYPGLRVVLVGPDNALLQSLVARFDTEFLASEPRGLSAAINEGWEFLSRDCEFLSWLGDDDLLSPGSLQATARALQNNPKAHFAFGRTRYIDKINRSIYVSQPTSLAPYYMRFGQDYVPQPGSLIRTSSVSWSPLLREDLKNAMDLDLFLRLSLTGRETWKYVAQEVSAYRVHDAAITHRKGAGDESEPVRRAYRGSRFNVIMAFMQPARRFVEKMIIWPQWHTPTSKGALVHGVEYTHWLRQQSMISSK